MYAYVKFDNGYFGTVLISQIPHYESPYDKFKKYKVVVDNITRDAVIIYTAGKFRKLYIYLNNILIYISTVKF